MDKITIREAFQTNGNKYLVELKNKTVSYESMEQFPEEYLPTEGAYMEVGDGEFDDEIKYYKERAHEIR